MRRLLPLLLLAAAPAPDPLTADQAAIRAHVQFLASDALRGREAGTPDHQVAAEYVAARMAAAGLEGGGPAASWFQQVPLLTAKLVEQPAMALVTGGQATPLAFGVDFAAPRSAPGPEQVDLTAPVVFVGYGVSDRASEIDDYRGLDVRGKIVAMLSSGPVGLNSEVGAHLGNAVERAKVAAAKGAVGVITIQSARAVTGFGANARNWDVTSVTWAGPDGKPRDGGARALGLMSHAGAAKLFAGSRLNFADVLAANKAGTRVPTAALATSIQVRQRFALQRVASPNVVGMIRGSDPRLRDEYIVLSAHLDHIGVTRPVNGDAINNGAMDNAIGIASMLEVARRMGAGAKPKRSILFVAVTAEEKGLIGSDYFAHYPTVPKRAIAANVNFDMPILTFRFQDLLALGADRSGIGPIVAAAAQGQGYRLVPDPQPDQARFVRTDHYSFVRQGIPSVSITPGPGGEGAEAQARFRRDHYHRPSDEITLPIDWVAAERFVTVNHAVVTALGDTPEAPRWVKGDYFGTLYKGPMAR